MYDRNAFSAHVVLIDYSEPLFTPLGNEAERLAQVGASWETYHCRTAEEVLAVARDADVVVIQSVRPLLNREVIEQLPVCRCLIRAGAGYDCIDVAAATEQGIMVCNTPTYCVDEVADHAMALLLNCIRHVSQLDRAMHRGERPTLEPGSTRRIRGATLGIIGLGAIGRRVAELARAWEMRILAYDPYISQERAASVGAQIVSLDELLMNSDFISIHCPLTPETYHLLDEAALAKVKPGCILINDARGAIVDEKALIQALESGRLLAAGLDVTEVEPLPLDSPLRRMENVVLTPHVAAYSPQSRVDLYNLICEVCIDVIQGRIPRFVVNPEVLGRLRPPRKR